MIEEGKNDAMEPPRSHIMRTRVEAVARANRTLHRTNGPGQVTRLKNSELEHVPVFIDIDIHRSQTPLRERRAF